ncbi:MAG: hypothetical protein HYU75_21690, partial [Betaproteobacteria bacterium]|nr:hypothetical protein [Betaproteobacteria bacterium]
MTCASDSRRSKTWFRAPAVLACAAALCSAGAFAADTPLSAPPMPAQFDITGFIQEATLESAGDICKASDPRLAGSTIKVNNIAVIVPCNTILQMPAATLTWQELFALAPRDIGLPLGSDGIPAQTGLALKDAVALPVASAYNGPLPSYEVRIQGNVVNGRYIAGLIFISQQSANLGQGTITAIDYANAELHVAAAGAPEARAVRIRVNDPSGRFGKSHGAPGSGAALDEPGYDRRFSVDAESPTIRAATGYPMCVPRSDPFNDDDDPLCPQANRPRSPNCSSLPLPFPAFVAPAAGQFCASFVMPPAPSAPCAGPGCAPDPTRQAPFEIGDFIDFQGTLKVDSKGPYISAHTIVASLGIYTAPGTMPAYVAIDTLVQGVPAQPQLNLPQEATSRILLEGFSSDPTTLVDVFAIDLDPATGASTERWLGTATPNTLAVMGRFRFFPNAGEFSPPTREIRAVARTMCGDESYWCEMPVMPRTYANGLLAGQ